MKNLKLFVPVLFIIISGCRIFKNESKEKIQTGLISLNEVKHYKWFKQEYKKYNFLKNVTDSLAGAESFKITIVGGDWCSDTKIYLPRIIKILEEVKFLEENLKIIFVDRSKQKPEGVDNSFDGLQIKFVPTFIVYDLTGNEIGRIVESPKKTLEEDLLKIIATKAQNH